MDTAARKETGFKKLWFKVRASIKSGKPIATATATTTEPITPKTVISPPINMTTKAPENKPAMTAKDDAARRFERAQAIFKKYDMELDPAEWVMQPKGTAERVQKQPRMRVRWTCHECNGNFGRDKTCRACTHDRCTQCVRYPPKKIKAAATKDAAPDAKMPTTGPCHECRTEFSIGATECSNCQHKICDQCLKETIVESPATAPPQSVPAAA